MESIGTGRVTNVRWEHVPDCGGCIAKSLGDKGSADTRNR